ncbi:hypothetical protein [Roseibium album]|uniref:hypothetical protein n=1 Tax=Roseibium album TaxID=311410 RepID=UPI00249364B6|nr:hypothetical protein [Roseibium album]
MCSKSAIIAFTKAHVAGNDFVIVCRRDLLAEVGTADLAQAICANKTGIGGDQLLVLGRCEDDVDRVTLAIWNPDGTRSPFCGNACIACAAFISEDHPDVSRLQVDIDDQSYFLQRLDGSGPGNGWALQLPPPEEAYNLDSRKSDFFVRNGTVHRVVLGSLPQEPELVNTALELSHEILAEEQTNVMFVSDIKGDRFAMRSWERGGTGLSLACASGAAAAAWVLHATGRVGPRSSAHCAGGVLHIHIDNQGIQIGGHAAITFTGKFFFDAMRTKRPC